jgi:ribonucleotide reductase beta subunit family protein with ferritin-like domain
MTPTSSFVVKYPQFVEFAKTQLETCYWTDGEIDVEKDVQDLRVNVSAGARHGIIETLKLFTKYEQFAGEEYWFGRVMKAFPRPEVQRMAAVFGAFELAVHSPFYNKLNQALNIDTDEFYEAYEHDKVLSNRVMHLNAIVDSEDDLMSLGMFSMMEGAILFSAFSYLKSFQSNGNNYIGNVVAGINQSTIDEGLHQQGGAALFRTAIEELRMENGNSEEFQKYLNYLELGIKAGAVILVEHEDAITDKLFEKGAPGTGITAHQCKTFVRSRVDICLTDLGFTPIYNVNHNPIANWFYGGIQKYVANDFFVKTGREYKKAWDEKKFVWKQGE